MPHTYPESDTLLLLNEYATKKDIANEKIRKQSLVFNLNDIKHITFEIENDNQVIIETLEKKFGIVQLNQLKFTQLNGKRPAQIH